MKNIRISSHSSRSVAFELIILVVCAFILFLLWSVITGPVSVSNCFGLVAGFFPVYGSTLIYSRYRKIKTGPWIKVSDRGVKIFFLFSIAIFLVITAVAYFEMNFRDYLLSAIIFAALLIIFTTAFFINNSRGNPDGI